MSVAIKKYTLNEFESVQDVAFYQLGSRDKWIDIVAINNLRSPYISTVPTDQFGPLLGVLSLQKTLHTGATTIHHFDTAVGGAESSVSLLVPGNVIVFTTYDLYGAPSYDIALIQSVSRSMASGSAHLLLNLNLMSIDNYRSLTRQVSLSKTRPPGIFQDHVAGELFQIYGSPFLTGTAVAQVGDTISLPLVKSSADVDIVSISNQDIIDHLGVDIALDKDGQKSVSPTGGLALVSGINNLKQALTNRIRTPPGELQMHPSYGCAIQFYLGSPQDAGWPALVKGMVYNCVIQDARVQNIPSITFVQRGDASLVEMEVQVSISGQIVTGIFPLTIA